MGFFATLQDKIADRMADRLAGIAEKATVATSVVGPMMEGSQLASGSTQVGNRDQYLKTLMLADAEDMMSSKKPRIQMPYLQNGWVYSCDRVIGENYAPAKWVLKAGDKDVTDSTYPGRLFKWISPQLNYYSFKQGLLTWMNISGEALVRKVRYLNKSGLGNQIVRFKFMNPWSMEEQVDSNGDITQWKHQVGLNQWEYIDPDDIVSFRYFNPFNANRGMSPLTAFMIDLNIDFAANRFNLDYFHKDMMPPTVLETPNKLSEPDKERMNAQWEQLHGGLDKKHGIGFATGGTKVIKLGYNQTESMFFEQKGWSRLAVCAALNVPPPMVMILEHSTVRANMKELKGQLWESNLMGKAGYIESAWESDVFMKEKDLNGITLTHDLSGIEALREDESNKADTAKKHIYMGRTFREVNEKFKLGYTDDQLGEDADRRFLASDLVPMDQAQEANGGEAALQSVEPPAGPQPKPIPAKPIKYKIMVDGKTKDMDAAEMKMLGESKRRRIQAKQAPLISEFHRKLVDEWLYKMRQDILGKVYALKTKSVKSESKDQADYNPDEIINNIQPDLNKYNKILMDIAALSHAAAFTIGGQDVAQAMGMRFDIQNHMAQAYLQKKRMEIVVANETIRDQITAKLKPIIEDAFKNGVAYDDVADKVAEAAKNILKNAQGRSATIAQNEITECTAEGNWIEMKALGVKKCYWSSSHNPIDPREDHAACNGEVKEIGGVYSCGLTRPHQPGAPLEDVINCECMLLIAA